MSDRPSAAPASSAAGGSLSDALDLTAAVPSKAPPGPVMGRATLACSAIALAIVSVGVLHVTMRARWINQTVPRHERELRAANPGATVVRKPIAATWMGGSVTFELADSYVTFEKRGWFLPEQRQEIRVLPMEPAKDKAKDKDKAEIVPVDSSNAVTPLPPTP